jgi:hypothetical protein
VVALVLVVVTGQVLAVAVVQEFPSKESLGLVQVLAKAEILPLVAWLVRIR